MRNLLAAVLAVSLPLVSFAFPPPQPKHPQIRGEGCVEAGVETRCLVVKDVRTGALFELFFKGIQPAMGTGIEFSGVPHHGITTCSQGTVLDVLNWVHKDLKCTEGTAPKPRK
ncbi:MAG TPA: hypothetical protein VGI45_17565 [Terracidiphilus sp.]|jgi:hypothetical protein